jgi:DNA-binding MarR family transcriptional regulator
MVQDRLTQQQIDLAQSLLTITPKLVRRLNADVPLDNGVSEGNGDLQALSELRATPGQLTLLRILVEHKQCSMQELAEHLVVTPSTATAMVKRLLASGYLERSRDDVDWRTVWVTPTLRGKQVVTTYDNAQLVSLHHRLAQLSSDERDSIARALPALHHLIAV